jgi:hypothetical protein
LRRASTTIAITTITTRASAASGFSTSGFMDGSSRWNAIPTYSASRSTDQVTAARRKSRGA